MKNVSNEFKEIIKAGGPFYAYAKVVLANGEQLTVDSENDFSIDGNGYSESGGSGFPLGVAMSKQIAILLDNSDDRYSGCDFYGAKITLYTEVDIPGGTVERIPEGIFTVIDSVAPGDVLEITACDNMYKLDAEYTSKLAYPATLQQMWNELCSIYDLSSGSPTFSNNDFTVQTAPTGLTGREVAGYIAQMAIGNAVCDVNGRLCIKTYDFTPFDNVGTVSADEIETALGVHVLSLFSSAPDIGTDAVKITGITTVVNNEESGEDTTIVYGTDEYALSINNPLITGQESTAIAILGDALIGVTARPFSGDFLPNPTIEIMDLVYIVDRKDNVYPSFITENNFEYLGNSDLSNDLEPPERNRSTYSGNATEVYRRLQQQINNQKSSFEEAVDNLEDQLKNSSGLYSTEEEQPDGSIIYYFHNEPTLEESGTIIKITAQALGISTDGGESYPVGITVDGDAIVKILQTIGIKADWINTGALTVKDNGGKIIFQANISTGQVIISGDHVTIGNQTASEAIQDALDKAQSAEDAAINAKDMTVTLSNDYQSIPVDAEGNYTVFPECKTTVTVTYGSSDITSECVITTQKSIAVTGSWDNSTKTYTVTGLSSDTGWVDIKVTYLSSMVKTKRFNIAKLYAGAQGNPGASGTDGRVYFLESNAEIIKSGSDTMTPSYIRATSYYRSGTSTSKVLYAGRFKVEESYDGGDSWTTIYTSAGNETEVLHSLYTFLTDDEGNALTDDAGYGLAVYRDISMVRISLYAAGGTSVLIDQQVYTVVKDVDALTHEEIFNLLTNNGQVKGIYKEGDQLYISFTYAKGGQLTLGGANNGNGVLVMLDANGNKIGRWDNAAWEMTNPASGRTVRMIDGNVYLLLNGEVCGRIGAFRWGNNATDPEGTTYLTGKKYLGIGHYNQDGTGESDIVINNGLNPDGATERIIYRGTERHQNNNYFEKNVYIGPNGARISSFTDSARLTIPEGLDIGGRFTCDNAELESITKIGNKTPYSGRISLGVNGNSESFLEVKDGLITGVVTEILS